MNESLLRFTSRVSAPPGRAGQGPPPPGTGLPSPFPPSPFVRLSRGWGAAGAGLARGGHGPAGATGELGRRLSVSGPSSSAGGKREAVPVGAGGCPAAPLPRRGSGPALRSASPEELSRAAGTGVHRRRRPGETRGRQSRAVVNTAHAGRR